MDTKPRVAVVVGGGIIGCAIARGLAREGIAVTIVDRAKLGREASHDAAGMLAPQTEAESAGPFLDLCLESRALYPAFVEELYAEVGSTVGYRNDGTFLVAFDEDEAERLRQTAERHAELGLDAVLLEPPDARVVEPAIAASARLVLSIPGDHQVDNRRLVEALVLSCFKRGVRIVENTPVRALARDESGRICGVETTAGTLAADLVVVAAGSWSNFVGGFEVPVEPVKGQMLMLELTAPLFRHVLRSERCYVVPRVDGRVLIGATMERVGFDKSVSATDVGLLLEAARQIAPSLSGALGGEAWAGLRPATPDGHPAIGFVEPGLVAATGHFRNGILLAPVTAEIVAALVARGERHPAEAIIDPRRFAQSDGDALPRTGRGA